MSFTPDNMLVWSEIPTADLEKSMAFYAQVLEAELSIDTSGPNPMVVLPLAGGMDGGGVGGHIYPGKPAAPGTGPTLHFASPGALEDTMARVKAAGGTVISDPIALPTGRFFYARDLDGNSVGFFSP